MAWEAWASSRAAGVTPGANLTRVAALGVSFAGGPGGMDMEALMRQFGGGAGGMPGGGLGGGPGGAGDEEDEDDLPDLEADAPDAKPE